MEESVVEESELGALAKRFRQESGKTQKEVAREMQVSAPTLFQAEEQPQQSLHKLRKRIIEKYSDYDVVGPVYLLRKRKKN